MELPYRTSPDYWNGNSDASALLFGAGTSADRYQMGTAASQNLIGLFGETTATSGDSRGINLRLYFSGTGVSGEALRAYGIVNGKTVATGGTVNGAHISLKVTGGAAGIISGAGNASRHTLELDALVVSGGTLAVGRFDTSIASDATIPSRTAFLAFDNLGSGKLDYLMNITNASTTMLANAGTGANSAAVSTGGVASKVLKVSVAGTDYWLPLFSSNA